MNKPTNGRVFQAVLWNHAAGEQPYLDSFSHGAPMEGANPVAVVHGRLCPRKQGCRWCTALRDRIRSRTVR